MPAPRFVHGEFTAGWHQFDEEMRCTHCGIEWEDYQERGRRQVTGPPACTRAARERYRRRRLRAKRAAWRRELQRKKRERRHRNE